MLRLEIQLRNLGNWNITVNNVGRGLFGVISVIVMADFGQYGNQVALTKSNTHHNSIGSIHNIWANSRVTLCE